MKLISMTDFVLEQKELKIMRLAKLNRIEKYANFLKQPLTLGMFIPCDLKGLEVNKSTHSDSEIIEAKKRVLFKGFELENKSKFTTWLERKGINIVFTNRGKVNLNDNDVVTVEDLVKYDLELVD